MKKQTLLHNYHEKTFCLIFCNMVKSTCSGGILVQFFLTEYLRGRKVIGLRKYKYLLLIILADNSPYVTAG